MRYKYAHTATNTQGGRGLGRVSDPNKWVSGPDPVRHDSYYAWLRHRCQARFRKEDYELTWEQWQELWFPDLWSKRGRAVDDLCLQRINTDLPWADYNVEIVTRREHLRRKRHE